MNEFRQAAAVPVSLRSQYLASLPEPQEWFLEELVRAGEAWVSPDAGYAVFHGDTLVEFHAVEREGAPALLAGLVRARPFTKGLGKSFDAVLTETASALGWGLAETGFLFRKRTEVRPKCNDAFQLLRARPTDLEDVWNSGRDFYDSREEVARLFASDGLWIAVYDEHLVGSGVMIPIDGSGHVVDIGMVIRPEQRNRGFASLVVSELADRLESEGKRPICGCAERNVASKSALENAGFVSEHRLVQVSVQE